MNGLLNISKILLLGLLALFMTGIIKENTREADFDQVTTEVLAQLDSEKVQQGDDRLLRRLYGLNGDELENWVLYLAVDNMDVEELLLLEVRSGEEADRAYKAIEKRIEIQKKNFEGYGPEQLQLIEKNVLRVEEPYLLFVISEDSEAVKAAFLKSL